MPDSLIQEIRLINEANAAKFRQDVRAPRRVRAMLEDLLCNDNYFSPARSNCRWGSRAQNEWRGQGTGDPPSLFKLWRGKRRVRRR